MAVSLRVHAENEACVHCGVHVSSDLRRVYGGGEDRVRRCPW